jgi:catechol 2,3-dioxygenase-like lactoylglutathione lyase family enzyme
MRYRLSKNINLETPNLEEAVQFYHEVLGLRIAEMGKDWARFDTGDVNLFITEGKRLGPITEFSDVGGEGKPLLHEGPIRVRVQSLGRLTR